MSTSVTIHTFLKLINNFFKSLFGCRALVDIIYYWFFYQFNNTRGRSRAWLHVNDQIYGGCGVWHVLHLLMTTQRWYSASTIGRCAHENAPTSSNKCQAAQWLEPRNNQCHRRTISELKVSNNMREHERYHTYFFEISQYFFSKLSRGFCLNTVSIHLTWHI